MPKRLADQDQSPACKRTRSSSNTVRRTSADDKTSDVASSPHSHRRRTLSTISPAKISDVRSDIADPRPSLAIRRRMNPDSLAGRLGSELIKELEALLQPGMTEMPPFLVRQEIQQRYNIDRRHIYDWFHNKGLRVSSSEKRDDKREFKVKDCRKQPDTRIQRKIRSHQDVSVPTSQSQRTVSTSADSRNSTPGLATNSRPTPSPVSSNLLSYEAACHMQRYPMQPFGEYYDSSFFPYPQVPAYPQMHALTPYLYSTLTEHPGPPPSLGDALIRLPADRTSSWISEQQKIPYTPDPAVLSPSLSEDKAQTDNLSAILPLDNEQTLPQQQRQAFYKSLSDVLPPACGIEESVGSYKAYMTQQVQGYYDRLVSGNVPSINHEYYPPGPDSGIAPTSASYVTAPMGYSSRAIYVRSIHPRGRSQQQAQRAPMPSSSEFSNWLLYGGRSQPPSIAPSPSQTPSLSEAGTSTISTHWPSDFLQDHARDRTTMPVLDMKEILESPIMRSRNGTAMSSEAVAPRMHGHGDDACNREVRGYDRAQSELNPIYVSVPRAYPAASTVKHEDMPIPKSHAPLVTNRQVFSVPTHPDENCRPAKQVENKTEQTTVRLRPGEVKSK